MHFYMRNAKTEDIDAFKKKNKLKSLGMPEFIASGSQEIENIKHRFLVLPRFGRDIWKIFTDNKGFCPLQTVYRVGWQILNVLEYIHGREYVHADIKGSNILLGFGKGGDEQVYLLDYGLACRFDASKEFKPDPKKMHNGTIEYTSRDAHQGVPTMRGDIEILAYNLIEWSGGKLPWVQGKLLNKPAEVQKSKETFMKSIDTSLKLSFQNATVPSKLYEFIKLILNMKPQDKPDYNKIRTIFEAGIKECGSKNSGILEFTPKNKATATPKKIAPGKPDFTSKIGEKAKIDNEAGPSKKPTSKRTKKVEKVKEFNDDVSSPPPKKIDTKKTRAVKRPAIVESDSEEEEQVKKSPQKDKPRKVESKSNASSKENHISPKDKKIESQNTVVIKSKTPSKSRKVIKLNLNLDVSLNSDLVVVVNRKDKKRISQDEEEEILQDKDTPNRAGQYKGKKAK
jgi:vaccinia related kinase